MRWFEHLGRGHSRGGERLVAIPQGGVVEADWGCGAVHEGRMRRIFRSRAAAAMVSVAFYDVRGCDVL